MHAGPCVVSGLLNFLVLQKKKKKKKKKKKRKKEDRGVTSLPAERPVQQQREEAGRDAPCGDGRCRCRRAHRADQGSKQPATRGKLCRHDTQP